MDSAPRAAEGDLALVRGHYRFIDHRPDLPLTVENLLATHRQRTLRRILGQPPRRVLLVQDGSDLNFAEHSDGKGLGLIGRNHHSDGTVGLHMHSTLSVSEGGLPLGVTRIEFHRPGLDGPPERAKPPPERTTGRWLESCRTAWSWLGSCRERGRSRCWTGKGTCSPCSPSSGGWSTWACWCGPS